MGTRSKIAKKLAQALEESKSKSPEVDETIVPDGEDAPETEASDTTDGGKGGKTSTETVIEDAPETEASDDNAEDEPKDLMAQALGRIETLAGEVSQANGKVLALQAEVKEANAATSTMQVTLGEATASADLLTDMATQLLEVFDVRLGNKAVDRSNLTAKELTEAYAQSEEDFNKAFPSSQASDTSENDNTDKVDVGHSQRSAFPISRKHSRSK